MLCINRYTVECDCFDGQLAAGPIPCFLTSDQDELASQLQGNPALAHAYCQALAKKFFVPEELTTLECLEYVQAPRPGKGETPFAREWVAPSPPTKKPKTSQPGPSSDLGPVGDTQGSEQITSITSINANKLGYVIGTPKLRSYIC
jgi:hypothetical protein